MFGIENFMVFVTSGILLNLYPGPDSLYILSRSVSQGRMAGVCAALGISTGSLFHTLLGAAGFSAIILSSARAFAFLKYAGALYLLYQAVLMLSEANLGMGSKHAGSRRKTSLARIYRQGAITNILNPKVALFFMALLPQFIAPASPNKPLSFVLLGLVFISTGTIWCLFLALFGSFFSQTLRKNAHVSKWLLRANAGLFAYLGYRLATARQ